MSAKSRALFRPRDLPPWCPTPDNPPLDYQMKLGYATGFLYKKLLKILMFFLGKKHNEIRASRSKHKNQKKKCRPSLIPGI